METKAEELTKLKNLKHGEYCTINWFEDGGGEVYNIWDTYILFEIPQYGGEPQYRATYSKKQLELLVANARNERYGCQCSACLTKRKSSGSGHDSDCSVHNMPAYPNGNCDCN